VLVVAEAAPEVATPARVAVASMRLDAGRPLARAKHANYLVSLLALAEARAAGCDEALLLNHAGHVAEGATSNVFAVVDGVLVTPPLSDGPLPGVTREVVMECAVRLGVGVEERSLPVERLAELDEVFLTNSVVGIRPVVGILDRWEGARIPGPVTSMLIERYAELVREESG
jgi:branched-chain amino acid aminotransferase